MDDSKVPRLQLPSKDLHMDRIFMHMDHVTFVEWAYRSGHLKVEIDVQKWATFRYSCKRRSKSYMDHIIHLAIFSPGANPHLPRPIKTDVIGRPTQPEIVGFLGS